MPAPAGSWMRHAIISSGADADAEAGERLDTLCVPSQQCLWAGGRKAERLIKDQRNGGLRAEGPRELF